MLKKILIVSAGVIVFTIAFAGTLHWIAYVFQSQGYPTVVPSQQFDSPVQQPVEEILLTELY